MSVPSTQPAAGETAALSAFLAALQYEQIPAPVVARCEDLFLDWFACTIAGRTARPVKLFESFAATMGPAGSGSKDGAQVLTVSINGNVVKINAAEVIRANLNCS
jgi:2-methylcitrate dehydratase PrpD